MISDRRTVVADAVIMYVFVSHGLTGELVESFQRRYLRYCMRPGFQQIGKSNAELEC